MVVEKDYSKLPTQKPYKVDVDKVPRPGLYPMSIKVPIATQDYQVDFIEGEPGESIGWHSHGTHHYQTVYQLEGRARWEYKDNDGKVQSLETNPGEFVFIPCGFENRLEVIGDQPMTQIDIINNVRDPRIEDMLGVEPSSPGLWEAIERGDREVGLYFDTLHDQKMHSYDPAIIE